MKVYKISIVSHEKILYINIYDIVYCDSQNSSVIIYMTNGRVITVYKQLVKIQSLLPSLFVRVSQCLIVNKLYIESISKKDKVLHLEGNIELKFTMPISKLVERIGEISTTNANNYLLQSQGTDENPMLEIA